MVVMQQNYYGGTTWLFKKNGPAEEKYITKLGFNTPVPEGWQSVHNEKIITSEGAGDDHSYLLDSLTEWSPTFSVPLGNILSHHNNFIDVATDVKTAHDNTEALLVATLEKNGEVLFFSGTDFKSFYEPGLYPDGWFSVHHSVKLADINLHHTDLWLNVFVWNKSKDNIIIDNLSVTVREGNPLLYGLYEKLPSR